jgi:serine O-acetyltransferase
MKKHLGKGRLDMKNQTQHSDQRCANAQNRMYDSMWNTDLAHGITAAICDTYGDQTGINHIDGSNMPQSDEVIRILEVILEVLFPGYTGRHEFHRAGIDFAIGSHVEEVFRSLTVQIERAFAYGCKINCCEGCDCIRQAEEATIDLLKTLPAIREVLKTDVQAALDGDPAAKSTDEIVISYPGLKAIAIQRVAHELYLKDIPLLPRVMGEYAHMLTGIDIHPGATIGRSFFIDHGTGVVIGETAVLGDNIKIYQGVTLGALSFPKDERGKLIKGAKRHPNIEDNVTIYAGATILGDITIGHDSVVGGNVWLTEGVEPHTKVMITAPDLAIAKRRGAKG